MNARRNAQTGIIMKKSKRPGAKKLLVLGLVLAYMCMAAACTNDDKGSSNSGSMAGSGSQDNNSSSAADNNNGTAGSNNNSVTEGTDKNGGTDGILDDAGDTITNVIDDVTDGVSDVADDILGDGMDNSGAVSTEDNSTKTQ